MSFSESYVDFDLLLREFVQIRKRNLMQGLRIATERNQPLLVEQQKALLKEIEYWPIDEKTRFMFAEGALVLIAVERFLRMILQKTGEAFRGITLSNLLDGATGGSDPMLVFPSTEPIDKAKKDILLIRNTLLHGNLEQLAKSEGFSVEQYFGSRYTPAIEGLFRTLNSFLDQVDPSTGQRKKP